MDFSEEHKKKIEDEIVTTMIHAAQTNIIKEDELPVISNMVLQKIEGVYDQITLQEFLKDLASRWPIFKPLLLLEIKDMKEKVEDEVAEGVLLLAKYGKIENAIQLAKSATKPAI